MTRDEAKVQFSQKIESVGWQIEEESRNLENLARQRKYQLSKIRGFTRFKKFFEFWKKIEDQKAKVRLLFWEQNRHREALKLLNRP